ncbi:uncharacterized protein LOC107199196 [Parus major]|uniref:uncharacterized protein LOC107199196 n=1 Tax=Parus major TaxID=9157 RepID=UPI0014440416|nr:uncharacterized protein LOC107199196 [Parus major]
MLEFAECLVRTAWRSLNFEKPPGPSAQCVGLAAVAPARCCTQGRQPAPHTLLPSLGPTASSPGSCGPELGADGAPALRGCRPGRHRGSPGSSRPSAPSRARRQRLLAGPQGWAGTGGRGWPQAVPGRGAEPAPTLPSYRSLQLAQDESRAAEHLRRALPYLHNPQERLRAPAIRFIGMAGRLLRGQQEELQVLTEALQALRRDGNPSHSNTALQEIFSERAAELHSSAGSE